jgi:predicted ArsR family transcriptional regulator
MPFTPWLISRKSKDRVRSHFDKLSMSGLIEVEPGFLGRAPRFRLLNERVGD